MVLTELVRYVWEDLRDRQPDRLLGVTDHPQHGQARRPNWLQQRHQHGCGGLLEIGGTQHGPAQHFAYHPQLLIALLRLEPVQRNDEPAMLGDRGCQQRGQILLTGAQQRQVGFQQVLHMTIRDLHGGLGVQVVPDLGARLMLTEAQRPDTRDDVHAIRRALDLSRLRTCRAKNRTATGALGRRAAIAKVGDVLDAIQRLDPFGPDRVAIDQASPTPQALDHLGPIANVRTDSKAARRLHRGPLQPTEPLPRLRLIVSRRCRFCRDWFFCYSGSCQASWPSCFTLARVGFPLPYPCSVSAGAALTSGSGPSSMSSRTSCPSTTSRPRAFSASQRGVTRIEIEGQP